MKVIHFLLIGLVSVLLIGCATTPVTGKGCSKCACKMMQPSAADPHKCAMCGHTDAEHNKATEGKTESGAHVH